jgi:hypothetical protein
MAARQMYVFTTDELTALLGLDPKKDKWRVVRFAESKEYKIVPSIKLASGSGSRRLYDLENVCEFAIALQLLEIGLRSQVIGEVIQRLRRRGKLSSHLRTDAVYLVDLTLLVRRTLELGTPLKKKQVLMVSLLNDGREVSELLDETYANGVDAEDSILVRIGITFLNLRFLLVRLRPEWAEENSDVTL